MFIKVEQEIKNKNEICQWHWQNRRLKMEENYPPYTITNKMLNLATKIMEKIGEANYFESLNRYPSLRRKTRIKRRNFK